MRQERNRAYQIAQHRQRTGFTLVELLVVAGIILLLTAMTVATVNYSVNADRIRASARQIQSLIAGARDRAIYAKDVRGIRLIRDPNEGHAVNAFQYVGAPGKFTAGTLTINGTLDGTVLTGLGTNFANFKNMGLIRVGSRIQIPRNTGRWYTIAGFLGGESIMISQKYADFYSTSSGSLNFGRTYSGIHYLLELQPQPLPDSTPVRLPKGAVIDLDGSQIPSNWRASSFLGAYSNQMDILFSAKGLPVGDVAGIGMMHLHVADAVDVLKWKSTATGNNAGVTGRNADFYNPAILPLVPADPTKNGTPTVPPVVSRDRILVTISSRTGNVVVAPVNITNTTGTRVADDPFAFAETGGVANK